MSSLSVVEFWEIVVVSILFAVCVSVICLTQTRVIQNYIWPLFLMSIGKLKSNEQIISESRQRIPDLSKEVKLD